jgi:hypothetical protein
MLFLGIATIVSTVFASSVRRPAALRLVENHAVSAAAPQVPQTP